GAGGALWQVEAGEDEALVVDGDVVAEPARAGIGADEEEEMAQRATVRGAVRAAPEHSGGEAALTVAGKFDDFLADMQVHVGQIADAVDEVARHRRLDALPSHDQVQALEL